MHGALMDEIEQYIRKYPRDVQEKLRRFRKVVTENAPGSVETVGYGVPSIKLGGNLIYYAAFKKHLGFYPTPDAIRKFEKELAKYETARGFPLDRPIPYGLIKKMVRYRVKQTNGD